MKRAQELLTNTPENDPIVITNECPQNESEKRPIAQEPQTASSRESTTSPASDKKCAVNVPTKVPGRSKIQKHQKSSTNFIIELHVVYF